MRVYRMGLDWVLGFIPYGDEWRKHRRMLGAKFGPHAVRDFFAGQEFVSSLLIERLLQTPENLDSHCHL